MQTRPTRITNKRPLLSIITVTWNHADEIGEYLDQVAEVRKHLPLEMVIVDNCSSDGTADLIERDYPWVVCVRNDFNAGFAVGCNHGIDAARGQYLLMLNPDARANKKALAGMLRYLKTHRDVAMVGCMLLHDDGLPQQSAFRPLTFSSYWTNHSMFYPVLEKARKLLWKSGITRTKKPKQVGWMQGSCMMASADLVKKVGGFEPSYFIYGEDIDWCFRFRKAGYTLVYLPGLSLYHRQSGSAARKPEWCFRKTYHSLAHFASLNLKGKDRSGVYKAMKWDMQLRIPVYTLLSKLRPGQSERYLDRIASVKQILPMIIKQDSSLFQEAPPQ